MTRWTIAVRAIFDILRGMNRGPNESRSLALFPRGRQARRRRFPAC